MSGSGNRLFKPERKISLNTVRYQQPGFVYSNRLFLSLPDPELNKLYQELFQSLEELSGWWNLLTELPSRVTILYLGLVLSDGPSPVLTLSGHVLSTLLREITDNLLPEIKKIFLLSHRQTQSLLCRSSSFLSKMISLFRSVKVSALSPNPHIN